MSLEAYEIKRGAALISSFVGRRAELESLDQLLRERRLLTVLGPPGVGKTRLALEYITSRQRETREGERIWFCDLTAVRSPEKFWGVVSQAIGAPPGRWGSDAVAQLGASLSAQGDSVLVLDNFEQLVPHAAETVGELLGAAVRSRCLITSRERLRLPGESLIELRPLPLPTEQVGVAEASRWAESVQLFLERANEVRPDYRLTAKDAPHIVSLVRELDGLPLAIELAAARMRVLSPPQILKNLDRRFQLLATSRNEGSPSKKTLQAAIDRSWELLLPFEQTALAECSVFCGGFSLEAAEQILDLSAYPEAAFPLDVLQSLCDKSLLYYYELEEPRGEPRYSLYRSIREYASQRLKEMGRAESARRRHAAYFLRVSKEWVEQFYRGGRAAAQRRLSPEVENLLLAREHYGRAFSIMREVGDRNAEGLLLNKLASLEVEQGQIDIAERHLHQALLILEEVGDRQDQGPVSAGLVVAESGRWFKAPERERISLQKRRTLQKLMRKLAAHRAEAPGEALPLRALFEVGWPGERVGVETAANRVYTALWMLKKLGLQDILLSRDGGYLLDPGLAISFSPDGP